MKKNKVGALSVRFLLVSLLFLAALFLFGFIADEVVLEKEDLFDSRAFLFLRSLPHPALLRPHVPSPFLVPQNSSFRLTAC